MNEPAMTPADVQAMQKDHYRKQAVQALKLRAARAAELSGRLTRCALQLEQEEGGVTPRERMGWAINEIENYLRNLDFAQLARAMAALEK